MHADRSVRCRHRRRHAQADPHRRGGQRDGAVIEHLTVPADPSGYRRLVAFGHRHAANRLWAVEGTGTFGAGLTTALLAGGERVVEVDRPARPARRAGAQSDDIDAVRAARQALAGDGVGELAVAAGRRSGSC